MKDEISTKHATQLLNAIVRIEVEGGQGTGFFLT